MERNHRYLLVTGAVVVAIAALGLVASEASAHGGLLGWGGGRSSIGVANGTADGRFVTFAVDPASGTISNIDLKDTGRAADASVPSPEGSGANATHPLLVSAQMTMTGATDASQRGAYVLKDGAGNVLAVEDSPRGNVAARSVNGTIVTLTLPSDATIVIHDAVANWSAAGATVTYANGQTANLLLSKNATVAASGQVLSITLGPEGMLAHGINPADGRGFGPGEWGHEGFGEGRGHGRGGERSGHGGFGGGHGRR